MIAFSQDFISEHYGEDREKYEEELDRLQRLRKVSCLRTLC